MSSRPTFLIRNKQGQPLETVRLAERVVLFGIAECAYHRRNDDRSEWRLSHVETGALIGRGPSKDEAFADAIKKAQSVSRLRLGIARMREIVRMAGC